MFRSRCFTQLHAMCIGVSPGVSQFYSVSHYFLISHCFLSVFYMLSSLLFSFFLSPSLYRPVSLCVSHARPGYRCFSLFCSFFLVLPSSLCFTVISCVPLWFSSVLCGEERRGLPSRGVTNLRGRGKGVVLW